MRVSVCPLAVTVACGSWMTSSSERLRRELPAADVRGYLNAGTFGPMARSTFAAIADELGSELWRGRTGSASFARYGAHMTTARDGLRRGALERARAHRADALDDGRGQPRAGRARLERG